MLVTTTHNSYLAKTNAETLETMPGYISTNFVNSNGYVDLSTNEKFQMVSDYYTVNRLGDFTTVGWNTAIMDVIFEKKQPLLLKHFTKILIR